MKKNIFFLLIMPLLTYSQIEKGRKMIGGNIILYNDDIQRIFSFQPQFGYFLGSKFVVGSGMNLSTTKFKLSNPPSNASTLSLTPFVRYYVLTKKLNPFISFSGSFATFSPKNENNLPNKSALNGGIGNTFFINNNVGIDFTLNYFHSFQSKLNRGISSEIGFQIFL